MSELRSHLAQARDAHRAARYPGDLAADVLDRVGEGSRAITPGSGPRATARMRLGWRRRIGAGVTAAVAASIAVAIFLYEPPGPPARPADVEAAEPIARFAMPGTPAMPVDVPLAAPGQDLGAAPAMPDLPWMGGSMAEIRGLVF